MYKENFKEIEKVIENYFEGIFLGDASKLGSCLIDSTIIYGDINGEPYKKTMEEYLEGVRNRQSPKDLGEPFAMETVGIDILGNIAMAKVHLPMLGYNYYDYLSLVKTDNDWKIVNKIFSHIA